MELEEFPPMNPVQGADRRLDVFVPSFTMSRSDHTASLQLSLASQLQDGDRLIHIVERCSELAHFLREDVLWESRAELVIIEVKEKFSGVSEARNIGLSLPSSSELIAFVDDDAVPLEGWVEALRFAAERFPDAVGFTGPSMPNYEEGARELCDEVLWAVSCSPDRGKGVHQIRNMWGLNMAFRRTSLEGMGGFRGELGASGFTEGKGLGGEEPDFAVRLQHRTGGTILRIPEMMVSHFVPKSRTSIGYLIFRSAKEGRTKAVLRRLFISYPIDGVGGMKTENRHLIRIIFFSIPRILLLSPLKPIRSMLAIRDIIASTWMVGSRYLWYRTFGKEMTSEIIKKIEKIPES